MVRNVSVITASTSKPWILETGRVEYCELASPCIKMFRDSLHLLYEVVTACCTVLRKHSDVRRSRSFETC